MSYRQRLKKAMEFAKKDRQELAKALGVSVQAIGLILTGKSGAHTAENAARAARFLGVDWYWLATGDGEMEPSVTWPLRIDIQRFMQLSEYDKGVVATKLEAEIEACERRSGELLTTPEPTATPAPTGLDQSIAAGMRKIGARKISGSQRKRK